MGTITKRLAVASANNLATSQTPVSGTPLTLNGSAVVGGVGILDTGRRILLSYGNEAAARTLLLTGTNSEGSTIFETLAIPSGAGGTVASLRDYLTVTSALPLGGGWTAAVTLGTNSVGSTAAQLPSGYTAVFNLGLTVTVPTGTTAQIEISRDIPYALPQPYSPGFSFLEPILDWAVWPPLANLTGGDFLSDIDARVTAWRASILSGTGLITVRGTTTGLRT